MTRDSMQESQPALARRPHCRFCGTELVHTFVDLGMSPLCESYVHPSQLNSMEAFYPLHTFVCHHCLLVQLDEYVSAENIFTEYAYFSSYSDSWVRHAERYTKMAIERLRLGPDNLVVEIASNDGYLLQHFVNRGIPVRGIEPAANVAKVAMEKGIPTTVRFFGRQCARDLVEEYGYADLIIGNNVLAHVPDLNDLVAGMRILLKPDGVITMEFPHLLRLMEGNQFDTIYHEHFSYFSFLAVEKVFAAHEIPIFDVEEISTHGGSLRIYAQHAGAGKSISGRVAELRERELREGFADLNTYFQFDEKVKKTKRDLLEFLIKAKRAGKSIAGYGAPGKGNTLLNYCGIRCDFIDYTVDRNPYKHGKYTPGTHIPIFAPDKLAETRPDYVVILPWNIKEEVMAQHGYIKDWGGRFVVPIPELRTY